MEFLGKLYLPGAVALWCALLFALASLWGYAQVIRGDEGARGFARRSYKFFALAIVLTAVMLWIALARRDFRIEYVYQYSGLDLPWFFQLAAFWAGQKGSFLIWLFWGALLGLPLIRSSGKGEAPVMGIYLLTLLGLLFILVRENPFLLLPETPVDGAGLNPLLQDPWMVIHPPIMFIGYAATAIPFAFAMAALWRRDTENWAARAFPWALFGFMVLGTAILLGGYWAYKTLGWGGYWGWDPVENASLIPWLVSVALIHGLHMERSKGRFRRANFVLAALTYLLVLYGTFLTRSGVLADFSVHSFVDLGISGWLIALMGFFVMLTVVLMATRIREVPTAPSEDPLLSRGTWMVLAVITVLTSAVVVTAGTSAPLLTRFLENPGQVGPEFYNRVNLPIALLVAFLLALVPYLTWRGEGSWRDLLRKVRWPLAVAAGMTLAAGVIAVRNPFHVVFVLLATLALATNLQKTVAKARVGGLKMAGGYLAHVGVGIILLGILASSAYDESVKVTLEQGKPTTVEGMTLTFNRYLPRTASERERMEVEVVRPNGSRYIAYPRMFVNDRSQQLMVNPHIRKFPLLDLYISPLEFDPGTPPGSSSRVVLAKGESAEVGGLALAFQGFDLGVEGDAMANMASGGTMAIGAVLETSVNGQSSRLVPIYRFQPGGNAESTPVALPGGGQIVLAGINAGSGSIELLVEGRGAATAGNPASLSLDVTHKPLINFVWYGIYVILAGGALATYERLRQAKLLDRLTTRA